MEAQVSTARALALPAGVPPMLLIVIHTEEEFDWSAPFDRQATGVTHLREIGRVQDIFARYGARPIYVLDYPVAAQEAGISAIMAATAGDPAAIGAHLHPWVNPPFVEAVSNHNSFPGNLPRALEAEKLHQLTERISQAFATRPTVYLAGRYGFGPHTLSVLQELGYRVDLSSVAMTDFRAMGGPDYGDRDNAARWEGDPAILRVPQSVADVGFLCRLGQRLVDMEAVPLARAMRLPGILARCRAVERIRLSPEGVSLPALKRAARALVRAGFPIQVFSFHSPSVAAGFTPYVRNKAELAEFIARVEGFLRFFSEELGGTFASPAALLSDAKVPSALAAAP